MAVNKPVGDNARKGAVKKRTQLKARLGRVTAWTKRSKPSGEFMAVKKARRKEKPPRSSGACGGRRREGFWLFGSGYHRRCHGSISKSFERALAVAGALEEFGGDALPRFMAGQFSRKAFTSSVESHLHICNGSFVEVIGDHSDVLSVGSLEVLSQLLVPLLRLMTDQDHQARAPKLNIVALNHALGLFDCLSFVRAFHRLIPNEWPSSPTVYAW
jgi:hypothetical protein